MADFKLAVNENNKATEFSPWRCCGTVRQNPHMRAFWGSTISFFIAFLGWFALAPLGLEVATSMKICENQLYPPEVYPTRPAYVKYKDIKTNQEYCKYGKNGAGTDCNPPPASANATTDDRYDRSVLVGCICGAGTQCATTLNDAGTASVASTIVMRIGMGTLLERFGPVNMQSVLMTFGAIWIAAAASINAPWNYTLIRFFIGTSGASFVTTQFWCSLMFAPNLVGTANATAGGWGNLGGGVTQIFMTLVLFEPIRDSGVDADLAWRMSMLVPAGLFLLVALGVKALCWDMPTKRRYSIVETGKTKGPSMWDYVEVLKDPRVWVMIFQYGACFGTELVMNNLLATHFRTYFQMKAGDAAALASAFGLMNLFARSLGGILSDVMFTKVGLRGRIWAQFVALFCEAIFLFGFGSVDNTQPWYVALALVITCSLFVQMAEGTTFGIVPFMNPKQLAVVSAFVGAGGNLGAVIASFCIYRPITNDDLLCFKVHAGYVMFWAWMTVCLWWPEHGGMFARARVKRPEVEGIGAERRVVGSPSEEHVEHESAM